MNAKARYQEQRYGKNNAAVNLDGLDDLLDKAHLEIADSDWPAQAPAALQMDPQQIEVLLKLLDQLIEASDMIKDASQRLQLADERMFNLSAQLTAQDRLLDRMGYYKGEADKVPALEMQVARLTEELVSLRLHPVVRLFCRKK